jgi:hypothetical protein
MVATGMDCGREYAPGVRGLSVAAMVATGMDCGREYAPGVRGLSVAAMVATGVDCGPPAYGVMVATGVDVAGSMPPAYRVIRAVVLLAPASVADC